jgi:Flp pilus assembly protein CpaB
MNRSRVLILLGVLLLVGALAVLVILPQTLAPQQSPVTPTPIPEIQTTEILVAAQNIPRGAVISPDAVVPSKWPNDSLPPADLIITNPDKAVGKIARTDILRGEPMLESLIAPDTKALAAQGSDASLFIPAGKVAMAFPVNKLTSVGYSIGAGDHIDLVVSFSIIDVDQEGQFPVVPFNRDLVDELTAAGLTPQDAVARVLAKLDAAVIQPRLLSQLTLQNIEVLHVGEWPTGGILPKTTPTLSPEQQSAQVQAAAGTPTPTPPRPDMVILLVDQQQALILQWLQQESNVALNLVLRGAGDNAPVSTETVSYQYILTNFNITIPPKTNTIIVGGKSGGTAAQPPQQ